MTADDLKLVGLYIDLTTLLTERGLPTDPRKLREVIASIQTGCIARKEKSGPDCYYMEGAQQQPAERKSTISNNIKGAYTGQSNKNTWNEQVEYTKRKVKDMKRHYFDRFCAKTGKLEESWYLTGDQVYDIKFDENIFTKVGDLIKLRKDYFDPKPKADPRLKASVCMTEIKQNGIKVI